MEIAWPAWWKIINKRFLDLVDNRDRFLILYGSRDSTKSSFVVRLMIYRLLNEPYMRVLMIRKIYNAVKPSMYQDVKDTVADLGLEQLFEFREAGCQVICKLNGNKLMGVGTDDVNKIKSIANPTGCWYEEDILNIEESDWITITTSIRSTKARFLQDIYTLNPVVEGQDYEQNWFFKRFFKDYSQSNLSFRSTLKVKVGDQEFERSFTVHHSYYKNNRWITPDRIVEYKLLEEVDEYFGAVYTKGIFANKSSEGLFYNQFSRGIHVKEISYDPHRSIHLTFDFNIRPYVSASIWQIYEPSEDHPIVDYAMIKNKRGTRPRVLCKVGEIAARPPENRTKFACETFCKEYGEFYDVVFLYGDPAGKQEDTRGEKGANDFTIIMSELQAYSVRKKLHKAAPNVAKRGEFINRILAGLEPFAIVIDPSCVETIQDYTSGKEDATGRKLKKKVMDPIEKIPYEKYHHFTDGDDYFITKFLYDEYKSYLRGGTAPDRDLPDDDSGFSSRL